MTSPLEDNSIGQKEDKREEPGVVKLEEAPKNEEPKSNEEKKV